MGKIRAKRQSTYAIAGIHCNSGTGGAQHYSSRIGGQNAHELGRYDGAHVVAVS